MNLKRVRKSRPVTMTITFETTLALGELKQIQGADFMNGEVVRFSQVAGVRSLGDDMARAERRGREAARKRK